jgi:hypothetical protein
LPLQKPSNQLLFLPDKILPAVAPLILETYITVEGVLIFRLFVSDFCPEALKLTTGLPFNIPVL